jgi:FkbM family methyltransferase
MDGLLLHLSATIYLRLITYTPNNHSEMNTLAKSVKRVYVWLFARKALYSLNLFFYKLSMCGIGIRNYENDTVSGEKAFIRYLIKHQKLQSGVILDIGANIGNYTVMLRKNNISLPIFAFEPHPVAYRKLEETARQHQFTAVPEGAGDQCTTTTIYDYTINGGSEHASMYKDVFSTLRHTQAAGIVIHLTTIDDFVARNNIQRIALLKIDTEGNELNVLKGAADTIRRKLADVIQIEFNEMNVISRTFFRDIEATLPNYDFYRLLPDGLLPLGPYNTTEFEIFAFQNIVAMRQERA